MRKSFVWTQVAFAVLLVVAGPAEAISRYESTSISCSSARARVAAEGAVIFRWPSANNPGLVLFDRFVAHRGFCQHNEIAARKSVPTADRRKCGLLHCRDAPNMDSKIWRK